jgi:ABC-type glycerol-3-phosphate transport system permease component
MTLSVNDVMKWVVLIFFAVFALGPVLWMFMSAFKTTPEILTTPFALPSEWHWENIGRTWTEGGFARYTLNTIIMTVPAVIIGVALSTLGGYAFARFRFPGGNLAFFLLLYGLTVPFQALMIPLFYNFARLGLINQYPGLIAALIAVHLPFGIFLMRSFFVNAQAEIGDAARIDGCSEYGVFWHAMLPLARPGILALTTIVFTDEWKAFLLPLILIQDDDRRVLTLGLLFLRDAQGQQQYELMAAGVIIASLPTILLFLATNRYFQRGLVAGSSK